MLMLNNLVGVHEILKYADSVGVTEKFISSMLLLNYTEYISLLGAMIGAPFSQKRTEIKVLLSKKVETKGDVTYIELTYKDLNALLFLNNEGRNSMLSLFLLRFRTNL